MSSVSTMSTTVGPVVTYNLPLLSGPSLAASVVNADASATTLWANCMGSTNDYNCYWNVSMTFGPWALPTPPPSASTGVFDMFIINPPFTGSNEPASISTAAGENDAATWTYSVHCDITDYTVPSVCTTTNLGGYDNGVQTATLSGAALASQLGSIGPEGFAITAGYAKLAVATMTGASSSAAATSASKNGTSSSGAAVATANAGNGTGSSTGATSGSGSGVAISTTNAASSLYTLSLGAVGVFGLLVSAVML